jgi:hypothetical protein
MEEFSIGAAVALASALVGAYAESSFQKKRDRRRVQAAAKLVLMELGDLRRYAERVLETDADGFAATDAVKPDSVVRTAWETHRHSVVEVSDEQTVQALAVVYSDCFETIRMAGTVGARLQATETGISEEARLNHCIERRRLPRSGFVRWPRAEPHAGSSAPSRLVSQPGIRPRPSEPPRVPSRPT